MDEDQRPIGYWLKELDRLIEAGVDQALADERLARRHWQLLNVLAAHDGRVASELDAALRPFWSADDVGLADVLGELADRTWIGTDAEGRYELTAAGRTAHARVAERVATLRRSVADGVTADEYAVTVSTLRRMAGNVERALGPATAG